VPWCKESRFSNDLNAREISTIISSCLVGLEHIYRPKISSFIQFLLLIEFPSRSSCMFALQNLCSIYDFSSSCWLQIFKFSLKIYPGIGSYESILLKLSHGAVILNFFLRSDYKTPGVAGSLEAAQVLNN
jgi:hypothetical protein